MASAAMPPGLTIYNMPTTPPKWDIIGKFYVAFCCTWTFLVYSGMAFQIYNRNNPVLRVRGVWLYVSSIFFLHCYWVLAQVVYPIGGTMDVVLAYDIQYFFMAIWFPLGIAVFQAANSRFLYVAESQKQFTAQGSIYRRTHCNGGHSSWLCRFRNLPYMTRLFTYIGIGIIVQTMVSIAMWFACAKYHPTYGLPGTQIKGDNVIQQVIELGRGWEWWPTLVWFAFWTWIVAPYLLWKSWGIRDTLGWRTQTICCLIGSLHAVPMFLISSYVDAFYLVLNSYFPPSQWIHLSIFIFEIFAIFVPCGQVIHHWRVSRRAVRANGKWETTSGLRGRASLDPSLAEKAVGGGRGSNGNAIEELTPDMGDRLYTMAALDHVLEGNPEPLQDFSALRDFSGENIAFLTSVTKWKETAWPVNRRAVNDEQVRAAFTRALRIYADFISPRDADFPINISSPELKRLEAVFEKATRIVIGDPRQHPASPFGARSTSSAGGSSYDDVCPFENPDMTPPHSPQDSMFKGVMAEAKEDITEKLRYTGDIPAEFDVSIFDSVHDHIKHLVLYNTWVKYVNETIQNRRGSQDTERSHDSEASQGSSLAEKVVTKMRNFV